MDIDVLIVGAGPAGLRMAKNTADAGYRTLVLEKRRAIGEPVQCAGLVSSRVISMTETEHAFDFPRKAVVISPLGNKLEIKTEMQKAAIINRSKFDKEMASKAVKAGARIELNCIVIDTTYDKIGGNRKIKYSKEGEQKTIDAKIVIGADGPSSIVRRSAGMCGPEEILSGVQAVVSSEDKSVKIHLGRDIAPSFFLYELPFKTGKLIGLASNDGKAYQHLMKFLKKKGYNDKIISFLSGTIPLGNLDQIVSDRLCLIGDAASQVKPLSGGGIYFGLKGADICSEIVIDALNENKISRRCLLEYQNKWNKQFGKQISKEMKIRKAFKKMDDKEIDDIIEILDRRKVRELIGKKGDMDNHSKLIPSLIKTSPELLKFTGTFFKTIF